MWPMLLDMSREESKRVLRRIELEAYSTIVSAFRAQGDLSKEKRNILNDLQHYLSISTERHRAEVRRAVNDEELTTIAQEMCGPNISSEWMVEGRRLVPLMPRLVPQTAFSATASNISANQAEKNAQMPLPFMTGNKDPNAVVTPVSSSNSTSIVPKVSRPSSPSSNVVVLPSGMSIHIRGGLNTEEDEELHTKRRRRSSSVEGLPGRPTTIMTSTTNKMHYTATSQSAVQTITPMKITLAKSPHKAAQAGPSQKVILVSSSSTSVSQSGHMTTSMLQRSMSVPVVKTGPPSVMAATPTTLTNTTTVGSQPKPSVIIPTTLQASVANGNLGNLSTVAGLSRSSGSTGTTYITPTVTVTKPRVKTIGRQKSIPGPATSPKPGVVIPMGPQSVHSGSSPTHAIQIKPIGNKPTIQIKQEGGMKIITHAIGCSASKLLPRPSSIQSGGASSPVVVVSSSNSPSLAMVTKSIAGATGKVLNITTQGGKVIATTAKSSPNVVTVNPKTLQLSNVKTSAVSTPIKVSTPLIGKQNVIVVQKAQPKSSLSGYGTKTVSTPEIVSIMQKGDGKSVVPSVVRVGKHVVHRPMQFDQAKRIQVRSRSDSDSGLSQPPLNEWVDYDVNPEDREAAANIPLDPNTASAIKSLLKMGEDKSAYKYGDGDSSQEEVTLCVDQGTQSSFPNTQFIKTATGETILKTSLDSGETREIFVELDPETGMFYQSQNDTNKPNVSAEIIQNTDKMDIFSSAIAEAQLDLDQYQYAEEEAMENRTITNSGLVSILPSTTPSKEDAQDLESSPASRRLIINQQGDSSGKSFINFQDLPDGTNNEIIAIVSQGNIQMMSQPSSVSSNVAVTVEPTGLDTSQMTIEDFSSQRLAQEQEGTIVEDENYYPNVSYSEADLSSSGGKRKRKPTHAFDDPLALPTTLPTWGRAALSLLQRVSKFRGSNKEKGEISASAWFLHPVDTKDAPGYYDLIKQPMDFGSIRKKLESGVYQSLDEFHTDMLLVRDNCHMYNSTETIVRRDCDEVFLFYMQEYERLAEKLSKGDLGSVVKRPRVEGMPV